MTPRHPVKRAELLASACLFAFAALARPDWRCDPAAMHGALSAGVDLDDPTLQAPRACTS